MAPITTITFDLWETLIRDVPETGRLRSRLRLEGVEEALRSGGFQFPLEQIQQAFRRCAEACNDVRSREEDVSFDEQIDIFLGYVDAALPHRLGPDARALLSRRYADSYLQSPPNVDEDAARVLEGAKRMGFKVGLICNTGATPGMTQRVFLERQGLARFFDALVFSDEERVSKPATGIFRMTLDRLGAAPAQAAHVGDHPHNDVAGARRAGVLAVWLRRADKAPEVQADFEIASLGEMLGVLQRLSDQGPRQRVS